MKKADIGVALYLLAAFIMLIVPIPNWLLDILLACNIAVAFTVMFGCMFAKEVLDLSFFPTILLFTTIFRIALNVSSTRLILMTGDPGNVVATFGNYVAICLPGIASKVNLAVTSATLSEPLLITINWIKIKIINIITPMTMSPPPT